MKLLVPICTLLLLALVFKNAGAQTVVQGAVVRGDTTQKNLALVFTADEWGDGLTTIRKTLQKAGTKAAFFFTGRFYRNPAFAKEIERLKNDGHYFGPHSDAHLLYCDWQKRDSLLVSKDSFDRDLAENVQAMKALGLRLDSMHYFIPPFEWWNDSVAAWSKRHGLQLLNFSPGMRTNADYTWPELGVPYKSNEWIMNWLRNALHESPRFFNGAIVLVHAGTDPRRKDKLYIRLNEMIAVLKNVGYQFVRVDAMLE